MKMTAKQYAPLYRAVAPLLRGKRKITERDRWDALWMSGFPVERLYAAGLNDDHIDTALRRIARGA